MESRKTYREGKTTSQMTNEKINEKIKLAELDLEKARQNKETEETLKDKELDLRILRREQEIFLWEKDVTGAMKGEKFGQDLRVLIDGYNLERKDDGKITFKTPEAAEKTHLIQVNMGELDRLNSSGNHELGDRGLQLTYIKIQNQIFESLIKVFPELKTSAGEGRAKFDIYRTSGNDFSIVLKEADQSVALDISRVLSTNLDLSEIAPNEEPVPLVASTMPLSEGLNLLNEIKKPDEVLGMADETLLIELLKDRVQIINDFDKVKTRCNRMIEKIQSQANQADTSKVKEFYGNFYKEPVGRLFLEEGEEGPLEFDVFKARLEAFGAFAEHRQAWKTKLFEIASQEAIRLCTSRNMAHAKKSKIILSSFLLDLERRAALEKLTDLDLQGIESSKIKLREVKAGDREAQESFEKRIAILGETQGRQEFKRLEDNIAVQKAAGASEKKIRLAELDLILEKAKRDSATGLDGRSVFFQNLEKRLAENKPITVISADLSFLKIFDKEGGSKTGDQAIRSAGRVMDYVKRKMMEKFNIDIGTYRVGGDEFSLTLETADKNVVNKVMAEIKRAAAEHVGVIPAYQGATERYEPESLRFNFGYYSTESAQALRKKLEQDQYPLHGAPGSGQESRELSDALNRLADQRIEFEKAVDRFAFLLSRLNEVARAAGAEKEALRQNTTILISYSEKAIFGPAGRRKLLTWSEKLKARNISIQDLIRTEIIPMVIEQLKSKGKKQEEFDQEYLEQMIQDVCLKFAHLRIGELEHDLEAALEAVDESDARVVSLKEDLKIAQEDFEKISGLRNRLNGV